MGHVREYSSTGVSEFLKAHGFIVKESLFRGSGTNPAFVILTKLFPQLRNWFGLIVIKPNS